MRGKQMNADVGLPSTHSKGMGPACRHTRFAARLALFVALALGPSASAQITFDNTTSATIMATTLTFDHLIGGGVDRLLVLGISVEGSTGNADVTGSPTYNGVAFTKAIDNITGTSVDMNTEIWYMLEAQLPAAGTYTVSITASIADDITAGAVSVTDAAQQPPETTGFNADNQTGASTIQTTVTTLTDGAWIFGCVGSGNALTGFTPDAGETEQWDVLASSSRGAGRTKVSPTAGALTMGWTAESASNRISHAVAAFAEVVCSVDADCDDGNACTADTCNAGSCLNSVESAGTVCRASAAPCDATETCDGVSITCPVDGLEPDDTPCDDGVACTDATCQAGTCVFADDTGQITVNVEVDAIDTGVTRTLDFLITNCGGSFNAKTASDVFDGTGFGTRVLSNINADADWIAVREGHTLRRLAPLSFLSCAATVDLTGINALVSGDFQDGAAISQDGLCDITDFSVLARVFNTGVVASSGIGADATGDGTQGATDFAAIQVNFFSVGEAVAACPASLDVGRVRVIGLGDVTQAVPLSAIPVDALPMIGAEAADLNGDGMVDASDIREFARRHNLPLSRSFERTLSRLESGEVGRRRQ